MYGLGKDLEGIFGLLIYGWIIMLPLALWKAAEIVIWLVNHVHIDTGG